MTGSHYIAQDSLKHKMILLQRPVCRYDRHVPLTALNFQIHLKHLSNVLPAEVIRSFEMAVAVVSLLLQTGRPRLAEPRTVFSRCYRKRTRPFAFIG